MKKAANKGDLNSVHKLIVDVANMILQEAIDNNIPPTASDMAWIIKFLKDNDITADIDDVELNRLKESVKVEFDERKRNAAAIKAANESEDEDDIGAAIL